MPKVHITEHQGRLIIEAHHSTLPFNHGQYHPLWFDTHKAASTAGRIVRDWLERALGNQLHEPRSRYLGDLTVEKAQEWGLQ